MCFLAAGTRTLLAHIRTPSGPGIITPATFTTRLMSRTPRLLLPRPAWLTSRPIGSGRGTTPGAFTVPPFRSESQIGRDTACRRATLLLFRPPSFSNRLTHPSMYIPSHLTVDDEQVLGHAGGLPGFQVGLVLFFWYFPLPSGAPHPAPAPHVWSGHGA